MSDQTDPFGDDAGPSCEAQVEYVPVPRWFWEELAKMYED